MIRPIPPVRPSRVWVLVAALAACGGAIGPRPEAVVTIGSQQVDVELAETPEEQRLGLGERDGLEWGQGMLFQYPQPRFYAFWMKGMRFDIDIVWIRDGRIVEISHRVPHPTRAASDAALPVYRPRELADSVLEVPAGYAQAHGWRPGNQVVVSRSP